MIVLQKYVLGDKEVSIGIPTKPKEKEAMFELRKEEYLKRGYTNLNYKGGSDIDELDESSSCTYFIATYNGCDKIVGTARLLRERYLPTEKSFFFKEPEVIKCISREGRAEVSRLIVSSRGIKDIKVPEHLVMFGLFGSIIKYEETGDIYGGYSFVKTSLFRIFRILKLPIFKIENFKIGEYPEVLKGYFEDKKDPPVPIFYEVSEIKRMLIPMLSAFLKRKGEIVECEENIVSRIQIGVKSLLMPVGNRSIAS